MKNRYLGILFACFVIISCECALFGCARENAHVKATINEYVPLAVGNAKIRVQVAIKRSEQEKGLMYRTEMADDVGMLFVYKNPEKMRYWMKNVPIPLSIGFFKADGTLSEVRAMLPNDMNETASSGSDIKYVLEMNESWYGRHGVRPGDRLDLALVAKALELRGQEPAVYGLQQDE